MGRRAKPAKVKVEGKRPPARTDAVRVRDLEKRLAESLKREKAKDRVLAEALEQQTATSGILRVISSSPTDVQPVFDAILKSALRLCDAVHCGVFRLEGDLVHVAAHNHTTPEAIRILHDAWPLPLTSDSLIVRAIRERSVVHVSDVEADPITPPSVRARSRILGQRSFLVVPMLREGQAVGAIRVTRSESTPFTDTQVALLQTFADQAVIAIENVRLFNELQASNRELTTALDKQTATSDILGVISRSQTDVQPVFDAIVASAVRLLRGYFGALTRLVGDQIELAAATSSTSTEDPGVRAYFPRSVHSESTHAQAIRQRRSVNVSDQQTDPAASEARRVLARARGYRSVVTVPLLRQGEAIGTIAVTRREAGGFAADEIALLETFADQAVIAIENVRLFTELEEKNRRLTVALDRQTATSEILRVISGSVIDLRPVFDTIVRNAVKLCAASFGGLQQIVDDRMTLDAQCGLTADELAILQRDIFPLRISRESATGRAVVDRAVVHIPDIRDDPEFGVDLLRTMQGFRTILAVPMLREGVPIGALALWRREVLPFSDTEISLIQTFTDQAVIAIENVRLFNELQEKNRALTQAHAQVTEALEQQTATSEILRVISSSPADVQPVFETIAATALRLCNAKLCTVFRFDGKLIHLVALDQVSTEGAAAYRDAYPAPPGRAGGTHRAILTGSVVHIRDIREDPEYELQALARANDFGCVLSVPMLRQGLPIGAVTVGREAGRAFPDEQIQLLKTFADQAVIAIENVRLFKELQARNADLTEALDRQTATAEILRVISQSQTEVQPVFDAIVDNAIRLFRGWAVAVMRLDGQLLHLVAARGGMPGTEEYLRRQSPWPIQGRLPASRCVAQRTLIHIPDAETDPTLDQGLRELARTRGWRSVLAAPLLRDGQPIGAITVTRAEAGLFSSTEVELLQTFADQAVIAVENARLLGELRARTGELTRSVEELTALSDVGRALSSTLDLDAVLQTIVSRASQLAGTDSCSVYEYDEQAEQLLLRATHNLDEEVVAVARRAPIRTGEGVAGRMAVTLEPVQIVDIAATGAYSGPLRDVLLRAGVRALLGVPLLREGHLIGGLTVTKKTSGAFAPEIIDLLRTFASQSALAIQNARLFREIADKSQQLEAASRHKSEFLANMSHELRTPLNAVIGFSEVLLQRMFGDLNAKQDEYLKDIYASGQHLLSLINDILDLSKIEAGRMELTPAPFHLPSALDNAVTLVKERAARHGIILQVDVDPQLGELVGDERKVKQVLLNLLSNAVKFTPEGGRISLKAARRDSLVEIAVTDTGVGIAPEDQAAIFEEFRQVGSDETRKQEGTGLGLTLAKKFVELHGGRIWVESAPGRGSTFTFTLPLQ